jgi:hypothetical protein
MIHFHLFCVFQMIHFHLFSSGFHFYTQAYPFTLFSAITEEG